jgi:hypothetical protein
MRLSTAIRDGAKRHPQGFGMLYSHDHTGHIIASCALGAAMQMGYLRELFGQSYVTCPVCDRPVSGDAIVRIVTHLNDRHLWSRERIADWVETLEAPTPAAVPEPVMDALVCDDELVCV